MDDWEGAMPVVLATARPRLIGAGGLRHTVFICVGGAAVAVLFYVRAGVVLIIKELLIELGFVEGG